MIYLFDRAKKLQKIIPRKHINYTKQTVVRNGIYQLAVEVPLFYEDKKGTQYNYQKSVGKATFAGHYDVNNRFQLYKIYSRNINANEQGEFLLFDGVHIFFDEAKAMGNIHDRRFRDSEAKAPADVAFNSIGWTVIDYDVTDRHDINFYRASVTDAWNDLISTYGVEFDYELQFDGRKIISKNIIMKKQIGKWTGQRFAYGTNVLTLTQEQDESEVYTAAVGRGRGEESGDGFGPRLEFGDIAWSKDGISKPIGQNYIELPSATAEYGFIENGVVKPRIAPEIVFENIEDKKKLADATYYWLLENCLPKATWKTEVARIGNLKLGDTVGVLYKAAGIIKRARVEKIEYNLLDPELSKLTLGDFHHFENRQMKRINAQIKRLGRDTSDRITRIKNEWNAWIDNQFTTALNQFEQNLIDQQAQIEADRENMTNLIEGTRAEFTDNLNAEITQTKEYAEQQAQAKASAVQTNLDSFKDSHQQLYDEVTGNVLDIDTFLGDKSKTLKQQFDTVRTDFGTLQTDLDGVESDLTATKTDLQKQLDDAHAELEGIEVGGRNLVLRSSNFTDTENFTQYTGVRNIHVSDGKVFGEAYAANSRLRAGLVTSTNPSGLEYIDGQEYTYSITYKTDKENPENIDFGGKFFFANGSGGETGTLSNFTPKVKKLSDDVYRAYGTFKVEDRQDRVGEVLHLYVFPNREGYDSVIIEIHNVQIEFGNVLTPYSNAPEDTEQKITTLNQQIEFIDGQLSAKLEQTDIEPINNKITEYGNSLTANAQSIESLISKTELHDGDITEWSNLTSGTAEGLEQTISRVSTAEGNMSKAQADIKANADGLYSLITRVDGTESGIESLSTSLTAEAGKVGALITKTDGHDSQLSDLSIDVEGFKTTVSELKDDVITGFSEFEQTLDGFSQTVGQMEHDLDYGLSTIDQKYDSISSRVANIKLNTRNLIRGTDFEDPEMFYLYGNSTVRNIEGQKSVRLSYQEGLNTASVMFMEYTHLKANEDYFLVVDHRSYGTDEFDYLQLQLEDGSYTRIEDADSGEEGFTNIPATGTDWHQSVIRIRLTEPLSGRLRIGTRFDRGTTSTSFIDVRNLYLTNTLNREWVPHPRDGQNIDSLVERVSDIEQTAEEIRLSVSDSTGLASVLSISSTAMDIISENLNLTGNMNVRGQIESISVSAVRGDIAYLKTNILTSNSIDSDMIQSEVISSVHINVTNALVERIIARNVFANEVNALSIEAVHADLSSVSSRIMETNILKADWIQGGNALLDKVFATSAMFNRMMAKSGFVSALNTVTIDTDQITIRRPDGYQIVNNGVPNWDFSYADTQPRFYSSGSSITGTYYTTSNDVYTTVDATYFQHNTRYVNLRGYAYMYRSTTNPVYGGNVRLSTFGESNNISNTAYVSSSENSQGSPMFINLTLDLGKPDGSLRQIYTQTKVSNSDGYDQIRFRRLLLRFHG